MTEDEQREFEGHVEKGLEALPDWVREKIKNVALLIEDEPSLAVRRAEELGDGETLLGYYHGIPRTARGSEYGMGPTMPDTITLYRLPILAEAGNDPAAIEGVVTETIWHEFAHYFGMDEDEVRRREDLRDSEK